MQIRETHLGIEIYIEQALIILGNKNADFETLKNHYSELQFKKIKQTHSPIVIENNKSLVSESIEADGHWTFENAMALCISTADCLPIFIFAPDIEAVSAVHAGWRGVANRIFVNAIEKLIEQGANPKEMKIIVGPHIQKESFEVKKDALDPLLASVKINDVKKNSFKESSPDQYHVDLNLLIFAQGAEFGIHPDQISIVLIDTVTDQKYHSHRRDKDKAGRQISFITLQDSF